MKKHNWTINIFEKYTRLFCSYCKSCATYRANNIEKRRRQFARTDCDEMFAKKAADRLLGKPTAPENRRVTRL